MKNYGINALAFLLLFMVGFSPVRVLADYTIITGTGTSGLSAIGRGSGGSEETSQSVQTVGAGTLDTIDVSLMVGAGAPSDGVIVDIMSAGSAPGTTLLYSETVYPTGGCATYTITPSLAITATTQYWVYMHRVGSLDQFNFYRPCGDSTGTYADGEMFSKDPTWAGTGSDITSTLSITESTSTPPTTGTTTPVTTGELVLWSALYVGIVILVAWAVTLLL